MVDIGKILKRGWHILWNYRALWIFGFLLAMVVGGGGGSGANSRASWNQRGDWDSRGGQPGDLPAFIDATNEWFETNLEPWFRTSIEPLFATPESIIRLIVWVAVGLLLFGIVVWLVTSLIRYPSETAIMRMVDGYEQDGTKVGFKQGWRLGWSRRALRLWVIDILVRLPANLYGLLLLVLALVVAANALMENWQAFRVSVGALIVGLFALGLVVLLVSVFLWLLRHFFARKAILEDVGIGAALRQGWAMFLGNWQSAGLMWLVLFGLGIAFGLVSIILFIVLIPVMIVTGLAGLIVAAIPAALAYWIASLTSIAPIAWIVAVLVGMPIFLFVLTSPVLLINGWVEVFKSSIWTLTYREMKVLEGVKAAGAAEAGG